MPSITRMHMESPAPIPGLKAKRKTADILCVAAIRTEVIHAVHVHSSAICRQK